LLRNAAIVLGNGRSASATQGLIRGLADCEMLVRGACAWALGQLADPIANAALVSRKAVEWEPDVRDEIAMALENCGI
jgi:epoxyqueuosine reductase